MASLNPDFWTTMQSAYDKASLPTTIEHINVKEMIESWTEQNHYPVLNIIRYFKNQTIINILVENAPEAPWIFTTYTVQSDINFNVSSGFWIQPPTSTLSLGFDKMKISKDDWVIFNKQQAGKY